MHFRVRVLLQSRQKGRRAADGAAVTRRGLNALAVVVVGAALIGHQHARQHRRRTEVGAGARLVERTLLLLDLLEAGAPPLAIREAHLVAEIRVVAVDGVDHGGVALADALDARGDRIVGGRQARHSHQALGVLREVAAHRRRRQITRERQLRHAADVAPLAGRQRIARRHHVVGDGRIQVLERVACLQGGVGLVRAGIRRALVVARVDPDTPGGILHRDLERQLRAGRLEDPARHEHVDELRALGSNAHRSPLSRGLERAAQLRGHVARLGLADIGVDALLVERLGVQVGRDARVERVHDDVEQLILRDLPVRLDEVELGQGLGFLHDAAARREQRRAAQHGERSPHPPPLRVRRAHRHFPCAFFL